MAVNDLENLAEAQREAVRALAALTEQLRSAGAVGATAQAAGRGDAETGGRADAQAEGAEGRLQRALELASQAVGELGQATAANTQALTGLSRDLGELPSLLARLAGSVKDGGGLLGGILSSGLGLASLASKIAGLFGGGGRPEPAPSAPFAMPPRLALEVANTDNILAGFPRADRGQQGEVRVVERPVVVQPQVTVNVSAMDSRSFLDRSEDIARAVREAMLHMHPVNDLISEL